MTAPIVTTAAGPVQGVQDGDLAVFRGIPYGAPPVGERRFAPPVAPEPWVDPFDASAFGPCAPQNPSALEKLLGSPPVEWDEDCLRLNVWTPGCDDARRPVMVWLHGGSFIFGSGATPWYDGSQLARRDTVVVTINYRLGVFGYLYLEGLADGFDGSGNAGLLDQVAALRWVRDNIAGFGGDPGNVTVFGESAGAMSVGTLLGTPAADGLFQRAILQSGAASMVKPADAATSVAKRLLETLGVEPAALRDLPAADLLAAGAQLANQPIEHGLAFEPVIDGRVVPVPPLERVRSGGAAGVELLIGTNADEMSMFLLFDDSLGGDEIALTARADDMFVPAGRAPGEGLAVYRRRLAEAPVGQVWCAVLSDHTFRIPALRLAEAQIASGTPAWVYLFTYASPAFDGALRSAHALEIVFAFDNLAARGAHHFVGEIGPQHHALARSMADAWVAFARDGQPAAADLPDWPAYDTDRRPTMHFDLGPCTVLDDPWGDERALWDGVRV
ncbi:MAG: Carboxylesterase type [Acidimicrobiales bacterium]|nr:Carboxylesterase type [Acidimicrobiales bacterium]